jgi:hypothetical protein
MIRQLQAPNDNRTQFISYKGNDWRSIMANSKFSLCPRGFGRTSYHFAETLQMGSIPIHVYMDQPWIPYAPLLLGGNYTFSTRLKGLPALEQQLLLLTPGELGAMEARIATLNESHFSVPGVLVQIERFMHGSKDSDLVCQPLPATVRDA